MSEGSKGQRSWKDFFSKASGDPDELLSDPRQSGDKSTGDANKSLSDPCQSSDRSTGDPDESLSDPRQSSERSTGDADESLSDPRQSGDKSTGGADTSLSDPRQSGDKSTGDADESLSDPRQSGDKSKAVEGFCPICGEYFCETCPGVKRQKMTDAQAILDNTQKPSGPASLNNPDLCVEVCKTHHPQIICFYCKAHDIPGCGECMTLKHTACQTDRVQDISDGFQNTQEFQDIDQQLQKLHQELEAMGGELDNKLKNLDTRYRDIQHKIASVREQINKYLDEIEKKITDEAAEKKKGDETVLKTWIAENEAMKAEAEAMLQTLHDSDVNVNSLFINTKQAKHRLVTMEKEINKIRKSQEEEQYEFFISDEIDSLMSSKTPLGELARKSEHEIRAQTKKQQHRTQKPPTIECTATYNRNIHVVDEADKEYSNITDCAFLSADRMVVVDYKNRKVKLIDFRNDTVTASYRMSTQPGRLTALSPYMIAVALPYVALIQVLNVTLTFTLQREIKVEDWCFGIAYKDGKFAVSYVNPARVDILDAEGKLLHKIQPKQSAESTECILEAPYYITFGKDKATVIVSDWMTNTVSVVTFSGQILRTYTYDREPHGIVITRDGVLLLCNFRCIHVVSPDFKTSKVLINKDSHMVHPAGITYCEANNTLCISNSCLSNKYPREGGELYNQIHV